MSTLHPHVECLALLGWRLYPASRHIGPPALEIQARRQPTMLTGCRPGQPPSADHAEDGVAALADPAAAYDPIRRRWAGAVLSLSR
jgi:hypothetical protein